MSGDPTQSAVGESISRILVELALIGMKAGFGIGSFLALSDKAYMSAARIKLSEDGISQPSRATFAAATGRFRHQIDSMADRSDKLQIPALRVQQSWCSIEGYCDANNVPKVIPIKGPAPSFHALSRATVGDHSPTYILGDMRKRGLITSVDDNYVQLTRTSFCDPNWNLEQAKLFGTSGADVIRTLFERVSQLEPGSFFEHYENSQLDSEAAARLYYQVTEQFEAELALMRDAIAQEARASKGSSGLKHRLATIVMVRKEPSIQRNRGSEPTPKRKRRGPAGGTQVARRGRK